MSAPEFALSAVATALGVLLPIVLLGSFVFKLFQYDPLIWRSQVSLIQFRSYGPTLVFRCYNRTASDLVDVSFRITARVLKDDQTPLRVNLTMQPLVGTELVEQTTFPLLERGIPTGFRVPLVPKWRGSPASASEIVFADDRMPVPLSNHDIELKRRIEFIVIATGTVLATGATFKSSRRYRADELTAGNPQDIDIAQGPLRSWRGWDNFDGSQEIFISVYGSLVDIESFSRTLAYSPQVGNGPFPAILRGYYRKWNVAYDQAEGKFITEDGSRWSGTMVSIGIAHGPEESTPGAIYRVTSRDLWRLDQREDNYDQEDVSDKVESAILPSGALVYTYIPTEAARRKAAEAKTAAVRGEIGAVARQGYIDLVKAGYRDLANLIDDPARRRDFQKIAESGFPALDTEFQIANLSILPVENGDRATRGDGGDPAHSAS